MTDISFTNIDLAALSGPHRLVLRQPRSLPVKAALSIGTILPGRPPINYDYLADHIFYHDGLEFTRCYYKHQKEPRPFFTFPEVGGFLSSFPRRPRWLALLAFEVRQFGAFRQGDMIRITEQYRRRTDAEARTPKWHSDVQHAPNGAQLIENPHMYLLGSRIERLNTEIARRLDRPMPAKIADYAATNLGKQGDDRDLEDWVARHGGSRQLRAHEVAITPVAQPHRTAPHWGQFTANHYEFGRLKVLRVAVPGRPPAAMPAKLKAELVC